MRHDEAIEVLGQRARGELDASTAAAVDAHLAACPSCRGWLDAYRFTAERRTDPHPGADQLGALATRPDSLEPDVRARLEEHVARCPECAAHASLARTSAPPRTRPERTRRRGRTAYRIAVVLGLLAAGAGIGIVASRTVGPAAGGPVDILPLTADAPQPAVPPTVEVDPDRATILLALRMRRPGGDGPVVVRVVPPGDAPGWSAHLPAADVRARLERRGALMLEVPVAAGGPEPWTVAVTDGAGATLLERRFSVGRPD